MQAAARPLPPRDTSEPGEFLDALRKGALVGAAVLVLVVPPLRMAVQQQAQREVTHPVQAPSVIARPQAQAVPQPLPPVRLADFGNRQPSPDVKLVANWVTHTRDNGARSFVLIDKKMARVYLFDAAGRLKVDVPALMGEARGDDSAPGIGNKPLSLIKPWEKTTPAGRFVAELGLNNHNEDIVWVDYDNAISMHRIRKVKESERRFERLATPTFQDNRISNGCINLPVPFYEQHLKPAVQQAGVVVYVLPEVKTPQQVFGAWDVTAAKG